MSDQPKPAISEWTAEEVTTPHHGKWDGLRFITDSSGRHLGSMNEHEARAVVDAHNAALAAKATELHDEWWERVQDLNKQLAAEREKLAHIKLDWPTTYADFERIVKELREQLAAEVSRRERIERELGCAFDRMVHDYERQLAAERQKNWIRAEDNPGFARPE